MEDTSKFPDPVYRDTVLAPLFEAAKAHFVPAFRAINQAHLVMLAETGIVDRALAGDLAAALRAIDAEVDVPALTYTGAVEDYFFLIEAELTRRLGPDKAGALHTARSRNDMDHTVFKLTLRPRVAALIAAVQGLAQAMIDKAEAEAATPIVAYTHGQPAQPSTFGHYLLAATEVLLRDLDRLRAAARGIELCPMGAAAITTSGFEIDRHLVAGLLGFAGPTRNSYGSIAAVDYVTGLYSAMKLVFLNLGRLVQDFQFWASFEVGQLYVPNSFVQISSIMPQKRNPVPIEHLRLLSSLTVGRCDMMVNTMHNTPFTDMNDSEGEVQQAGFAAFDSGGRVLALLTAFIPALSIRGDRVAANADAACVTVTELADTLVREDGLSFRQAHEVAAETAKAAIAAGQPLGAAFDAFRAAFSRLRGGESSLGAEAFAEAVSVAGFIAKRERFGGPGPGAMAEAIQACRAQLETSLEAERALAARRDAAAKDLAAAFAGL